MKADYETIIAQLGEFIPTPVGLKFALDGLSWARSTLPAIAKILQSAVEWPVVLTGERIFATGDIDAPRQLFLDAWRNHYKLIQRILEDRGYRVKVDVTGNGDGILTVSF